jgi:hypothetical protein
VTQAELFIEKRAEVRPPDPPPAIKNAVRNECKRDECRPEGNSSITPCCGRVVFVQPAPGLSARITAPAALQPVPGDFDVDPDEWWVKP